MSELRFENLIMPASDPGPDAVLPPLKAKYSAQMVIQGDLPAGMVPADAVRPRLLPYQAQEEYGRACPPRTLRTAVLENEHLRALFLLDYGGRLWSLVDKSDGRELLFQAPAIRLCNLAVRDAWFAGGVEWNISILGHSPFTCAPLFAARVAGADGQPALRLWEFERQRGVVFQLDCFLPDGSEQLLVRGRIANPGDGAVPMYWWSNIAVPERPDVRVICPAGQAYRHDYDKRLYVHNVPVYGGVDLSYAARRRHAAELYFRIPPGQRLWMAAVDEGGRGLAQITSDRMPGRKMFNWGTSPGGRRWQEWLTGPGLSYLELQSGLGRTQLEYVLMPARTSWDWLEAYGPIRCNPHRAHSDDWEEACAELETAMEWALPQERFGELLRQSAATLDRAPQEIAQRGGGWGALERRRREKRGEPVPVATAATPFADDALDSRQAPWLALLETGELPYRRPDEAPGSYMVQEQWRALLEEALAAGRGDHWLSWLHLGIMRYAHQEKEAAGEAWRRSLEREESAWAYRNLAILARDQKNPELAAALYLKAMRLCPTLAALAVECGTVLYRAGNMERLAKFLEGLSPEVSAASRIAVLRARVALAEGDMEHLRRFFDSDVEIANLREHETTLSDIWFEWQAARLVAGGEPAETALARAQREFPPPARFDFRAAGSAE